MAHVKSQAKEFVKVYNELDRDGRVTLASYAAALLARRAGVATKEQLEQIEVADRVILAYRVSKSRPAPRSKKGHPTHKPQAQGA